MLMRRVHRTARTPMVSEAPPHARAIALKQAALVAPTRTNGPLAR